MIIRLLAILLIPFALHAQNDPKAEDILKKVSETNKAYKDIAVSFSYTLENKDAGINDSRDGELTLAGNKFRLQLMGQDIYSNGEIVWYVMKEDLEVHIKSVDEFKAETDLDPANIFNQYDKGFKTKYNGSTELGGTFLETVDLFPEDPSKKPYHRVRLGIDGKTNHVAYSKTFGKDGTNYILKVNEMKTNQQIAEELFVFNKNKFEAEDFDIIDFR